MRGHAFTAGVAFGLGVAFALFASGSGGTRGGARGAAPGGAPRSVDPATTARLEERLECSEKERARLDGEVEALKREISLLESRERAPERAARQEGGPRFDYPVTEAALRGLDWEETGEAVAKLMPLLSEAAAVIHGKQAPRPELFGEITRWSGPLFTHGAALHEKDVAWSHPSALANLIHATLTKAGRPLGERQEEDLYRIGLLFVEQDQRRRAAYGEGTLRLRRMTDAVRLQDRFYAEVEQILTAEQKAVLHPPGVRGIVQLDVFAGSIVWEQHLRRVPHKDRAELRERVTEAHAEGLGLRPEVRPLLAALVKEWEAALPDDYVFAEPDAIRRENMEYADRILFTVTRQAALLEALLARAPLDAAERERVLDQRQVLAPFLRR